MSTSTNQRLIVTGVLALVVVGAVLLITQVFNDDEEQVDPFADPFGGVAEEVPDEDAEPTEEPPDYLFPVPKDDFGAVESIEVTNNETGEVFSGELAEERPEGTGGFGGEWAILEANEEFDTGLGVDSPRINSAVVNLPSVRPESLFDDVADDELADFGLEEPVYTLTFSMGAGDTETIEIGLPNPGGTSYYAQVPSRDGEVYLIPTTRLDPVLNLIVDPPYIREDVETGLDPDEVLPGGEEVPVE